MKYYVLVEKNAEALGARVNDYMEAGWKPQGGVAVTTNNKQYWWAQAMIRDGSDA